MQAISWSIYSEKSLTLPQNDRDIVEVGKDVVDRLDEGVVDRLDDEGVVEFESVR